jgi:hypothetical protein
MKERTTFDDVALIDGRLASERIVDHASPSATEMTGGIREGERSELGMQSGPLRWQGKLCPSVEHGCVANSVRHSVRLGTGFRQRFQRHPHGPWWQCRALFELQRSVRIKHTLQNNGRSGWQKSGQVDRAQRGRQARSPEWLPR